MADVNVALVDELLKWVELVRLGYDATWLTLADDCWLHAVATSDKTGEFVTVGGIYRLDVEGRAESPLADATVAKVEEAAAVGVVTSSSW